MLITLEVLTANLVQMVFTVIPPIMVVSHALARKRIGISQRAVHSIMDVSVVVVDADISAIFVTVVRPVFMVHRNKKEVVASIANAIRTVRFQLNAMH